MKFASMDIEKNYYLILVDIKKSTKLSPNVRNRVFQVLEKEILSLNKILIPKPVSKLTLSYGDEIAGLFSTPEKFFFIVNHLRYALNGNAEFRFIATRGKIGVPSNDIRKIGGEIFKIGNMLMNKIKKERKFCFWQLDNFYFDSVLNSLTGLNDFLYSRLNNFQRQILILKSAGNSQSDISNILNKTSSSISKSKFRGGLDLIIDSGITINSILKKNYNSKKANNYV